MNLRTRRIIGTLIAILFIALVWTCLTGCESLGHLVGLGSGSKPPVHDQVQTGLSWYALIGAGIVMLGIVATAFSQVKYGVGLMLSGAGIFLISLVFKAVLWMVPWIAGITLTLAVVVGIYEIWYKRKTGSFDRLGDGKGNL